MAKQRFDVVTLSDFSFRKTSLLIDLKSEHKSISIGRLEEGA